MTQTTTQLMTRENYLHALLLAAVLVATTTSHAATPLKLEAKVAGEPGKPKVEGITNLPDGTEVLVSVFRKESRYSAGDKTTVAGGRFSTGPYSDQGASLKPGKYDLSITAPLYEVQPVAVKPLLGKNYANFSGALLVKSPYGTIAEYRTTFMVSGNIDTKADAAASAKRVKEGFEWRRKNCYEITGIAERLTGQMATAVQKKSIIDKCLAEVDEDERKASAKR